MSESNAKEKKDFLLNFCKGVSMTQFKQTFSDIMGKNVQCAFFDAGCEPIQNSKKHSQHVTRFLKHLKPGSLKQLHVFGCSCDKHCLAVPIIQGNNVYGFVIAVHLKRDPEKKELDFMKIFIDVALKDFQKEQELTRLYDTIRPRAIALSTIHTIHRLLSSTLDMDELIERITRLTLQVMRARHCSIMLLDETKNYLIPKAIIDLKNNPGKTEKGYKKKKIDSQTMISVARNGKISLTRNALCVPLVEEDIIGVICAKHKTSGAPFSRFDSEILITLAEQAVIAIKNAQLYEEQKKMSYGSIKSLAALLDAKSPHTYTHSDKFVKIVLAVAEEMRLPREEIRNLRYAALLPDTGKFSIPDEILRKRGGLSKKEFRVIKKQHLESLKILEPLDFLKPVIPIIMHHHERYDGTGYPKGLKGRQIPIGARVMAVADAFEAMVSARPYKDTRASMQQALKEIENNKGRQFDPEVVEAFVSASKNPGFRGILEKS